MAIKTKKPLPTKSVAGVMRYLDSKGFDVPKSTVHDHVKRGYLIKNKAGNFTDQLVQKYIDNFLSGDQQPDENTLALNEQKIRAEIVLKKIQAEREQFKLDIERGKYMPLDDFDLEVVSRALALRKCLIDGAKDKFPKKQQQKIIDMINEAISEYANTKSFLIIGRDEK